jgi:hypothetical protein
MIIPDLSYLSKRILPRFAYLFSFPEITVDIEVDVILPVIGH